MKKRILSIVLAICMIFTLVPLIGVANAAESSVAKGIYVCGAEELTNGAGSAKTQLNRMVEVDPDYEITVYESTAYELTAYNVPACENKGFVFVKPDSSYYITGTLAGDTEILDIPQDGVPEYDYIYLSSPYEWSDITYRLWWWYDETLEQIRLSFSVTITESHHHESDESDEWVTDNASHWKECNVTGCTQVFDKSNHSFKYKYENGHWLGVCSVCGFNSSGADDTADSKYTQACEEIDRTYTYTERDLGATYSPESTTFKVWAPTATNVTLCLYATGSVEESREQGIADSLGNCDMTYDETSGVWQTTVEGDYKNTYYTYTVQRGKSSIATPDPYAVAAGVNGKRSMVCDLDSTDPEGWENDDHVLLDESTDSAVWELHIKDFSYDPASGVSKDNRGKYLAFTETGTTLNGEGKVSTGIDYLKELGVTTVQINPFFDFESIDETGSDSQFNWGYDPQNFNVPEGSYASTPYDGNVRIKECKSMIQALHDAGICVVMDVDYTHTFSKNSAFQATVPDYYYRFTKDGKLSDGSGYGNDLATERTMYRNYIIQSLLYWVDEYHIDGFNFNSTGLMDVETVNLIREALDSVDTRITTWGDERFSGKSYHPSTTCTGNKYIPATMANADKLSDRFAFYNNYFSYGIKGNEFIGEDSGFIQGNSSAAPLVKSGIKPNTVNSKPTQSISYASCTRGWILYDKIIESATYDNYGKRNPDAVKMNKLAGSIVYMSQGIPFMLAGEEMCRSKDGDINSYKSAATLNMIKWQNVADYADVVSYYKGLMQIRKHFTPLTCADNSYSNSFNFNSSNNTNQIAYTIANNTPGEWSKLAVIFNGADTEAEVTLKDTSVTEWVVIANGSSAGVTKLAEVSGSTFSVPAYSALIAVEKSSFESAGISENTGKVTVNYLYEDGKTKLADSVVLQGTIGTGYQTVSSLEIPGKYLVKEVVGNTSGEFSQEDAVVTYIYENIPIIVVGEGSDNWLNGEQDNFSSAANRMTAVSQLVYEITYTEIAQGNDYKCFFSIDGSVQEYVFDGSVTTVSVPYELADVTLRLDLTDFDRETKKGAKLTVTVTPHHDHDFSDDWATDDTYHWHECQYEGCTETRDEAKHTGGEATCASRAVCEICHKEYGEKNPNNHTGKKVWTTTATQHKQYWDCCDAVAVDYEDHTWVDGVCSECKYVCAHKDADNDLKCDYCDDDLPNPCKDAEISVSGEQTVEYGSAVTIKATATNVPAGCYLAIYIDGNQVAVAEGNGADVTEVSYTAEEVTSDIYYTVKVIDKDGNVQTDADGNELSKDGGKITCEKSFALQLLDLFKELVKILLKIVVVISKKIISLL